MVSTISAALMVLGVLGQRQYVRATTQETWVAAKLLPAGSTVEPSDLVKGRIDGSESDFAVAQLDDIVGKRLSVDKVEGEAFVPADFEPQERPWMSMMVPDGRVIFAMVPDKHLLPYSRQLRRGDRFDILITPPGGRVHPLAFDAILLGMLRDEQSGKAQPPGRGLLTVLSSPDFGGAGDDESHSHLLVLAVKPEHVVSLASAQGAAGRVSFVVHGQNEIREGKRLSVMPPTRSVEIYAGLSRSRITVAP